MGNWPWRLQFALIARDGTAQIMPPMAPVEAQRRNDEEWALLITEFLSMAWDESVALEISDYNGAIAIPPGVRARPVSMPAAGSNEDSGR